MFKGNKIDILRQTCMPLFTAALLIVVRYDISLGANQWMNEQRKYGMHACTMGNY